MAAPLDFTSRAEADAFERALSGGGDVPADIARLAGTARRVSAISVPGPDSAFVAALGARLAAEAAAPSGHVDTSAVPSNVISIRRTWPRAVAGTAAGLVAASAVLGVASQNALPGDLLYGVRGLVDGLEVTVAGSDSARADTYLAQARQHVKDAQTLAGRTPQSAADISTSLDDAAATVTSGEEAHFDAFAANHDPAELAEVKDFTAWVKPHLETLRTSVPQASQAHLASLSAAVQAGEARLNAALASCGAGCAAISPTTVPAPNGATGGSSDAGSPGTGTGSGPGPGAGSAAGSPGAGSPVAPGSVALPPVIGAPGPSVVGGSPDSPLTLPGHVTSSGSVIRRTVPTSPWMPPQQPTSSGPSATGPTSTRTTSTGPTSTRQTSAGPTSTGPTSTAPAPTRTGPTSTGPTTTGPVTDCRRGHHRHHWCDHTPWPPAPSATTPAAGTSSMPTPTTSASSRPSLPRPSAPHVTRTLPTPMPTTSTTSHTPQVPPVTTPSGGTSTAPAEQHSCSGPYSRLAALRRQGYHLLYVRLTGSGLYVVMSGDGGRLTVGPFSLVCDIRS